MVPELLGDEDFIEYVESKRSNLRMKRELGLMDKINRLATIDDSVISLDPGISPEDVRHQHLDYSILSGKKMQTKYIKGIYRPVHLHWNKQDFVIQRNDCSNPYCKN